MPLTYSDDFNRADSFDLGPNWEMHKSSSFNSPDAAIQIKNNNVANLRPPAFDQRFGYAAWAAAPAAATDQTVILKALDHDPAGLLWTIGPGVRLSGTADSCTGYFAFCFPGVGGTLFIIKVVNQSLDSIAFDPEDQTHWTVLASHVNDGGDPGLKLEVIGTTIKVYRTQDNLLILTTTDSSIASGKPGFVVPGSASSSSTYFYADDWSATIPGVARTLSLSDGISLADNPSLLKHLGSSYLKETIPTSSFLKSVIDPSNYIKES